MSAPCVRAPPLARCRMSKTRSTSGRSIRRAIAGRRQVAVVDTGIDGTRITSQAVSTCRAFPHRVPVRLITARMVVFDALIGAPNAMIFEYPLLKSVAVGDGLVSCPTPSASTQS